MSPVAHDQQQLEAHLWGAANILRSKTAGQDCRDYILSLMLYKRLCDQWENEADKAITEQERQQGKAFTDMQRLACEERADLPFGMWFSIFLGSCRPRLRTPKMPRS